MNGAVTSYATVLLTLPNASDAVADGTANLSELPPVDGFPKQPDDFGGGKVCSDRPDLSGIPADLPEGCLPKRSDRQHTGDFFRISSIGTPAKTLCSCRAGICNAADRRTADSR